MTYKTNKILNLLWLQRMELTKWNARERRPGFFLSVVYNALFIYTYNTKRQYNITNSMFTKSSFIPTKLITFSLHSTI